MSSTPGETIQDYIGRTVHSTDFVSSHLLERLAATLDDTLASTDVLPPLWHWLLFQEWASPAQLGLDGHPKRGGFLPPLPELTRRVWGGGRVEFGARLRLGERVLRTSVIQRIDEKNGKSGRLVVVTVRHELVGGSGLCVREEQDLVYRETDSTVVGAAAKMGTAAATVPCPTAPPGAFSRQVLPDPVLLFRFSALTGNAHRIHYDLTYARQQEGYPGLVVHGPLQAIWLIGHLQQELAIVPTRFEYRAHRPAIAGRPLRLEGWKEGPLVRLRTVDADGALCMSAEATLA
jgi:hydroxyacyl-ACP dehydratase HTD2-like protein with hotdog domain